MVHALPFAPLAVVFRRRCAWAAGAWSVRTGHYCPENADTHPPRDSHEPAQQEVRGLWTADGALTRAGRPE
jgi:hypothetical protein